MVPRQPRRYEDLPLSARRRVVASALLRATLTVTVLVAVYYLVPLNRLLDSEAALGLLAGLVAFSAIITWQIKEITRSENPRLRAIQTLALGLPLLLLIFAMTYVVLARNQPGSFTEPLSRTDSLYFSVTVFSTVGFGDIAARSEPARVIVTTQMLVDLVVVGVIAKLIFGAVQISVQRRTTSAPSASDAAGPPSASE
ncbi:MAG: potassium channel family protein [Pseudonocardiaceae bacterium]